MQRSFTFFRSIRYLNKKISAVNHATNNRMVLHSAATSSIARFLSSSVLNHNKRTPLTDAKDLVKHIKENNYFYLKMLTNVYDSVNYAEISSEDAQILLNCCGEFVPDSSRKLRNEVCQKIFIDLVKNNNVTLDIYHTYIKVCTENSEKLHVKQFLSTLKKEPTQQTYKLLIKNVCEKGDINQAMQLLEIMKEKSIKADEDIFNNLVLAHMITGGWKMAETVLKTMRMAHVPETQKTVFCLLKGAVIRGAEEDLKEILENNPIKLNQLELIDIVLELGLKGNVSWLPEISKLYTDSFPRELINLLKQKCIHLVHMDKSEAAMATFQHFIPPSEDLETENYGFFILRAMIFCRMDTHRIIALAKNLRDSGRNPYILEKLAEVTVRHRFVKEAWEFLESIPNLRSHYFWPLLVDAFEKNGEGGIFDMISKMKKLNVKIDSETLQKFVLPFCNTENRDLLISKFKKEGFTVKEIAEPLLITLLRKRQTEEAVELCDACHIEYFGEDVLTTLPFSWFTSKDADSIVKILQKYCESAKLPSTQLVAEFLMKSLKLCKHPKEFAEYISLLQVLNSARLKIDPAKAEDLRNLVISSENKYTKDIIDKIDSVMDFGLKQPEPVSYIPHPRDMNVEELECLLIELKEKNLNTRGTLRLLILKNMKLGNVARVKQLREMFLNEGFEESLGMKSTLMHSFVLEGYLEPSLDIYQEIKSSQPNFLIDIFKILDLCTLLVKNDQSAKAMEILQNNIIMTKPEYKKTIVKNCLQLLNAFKDEKEQLSMLEVLKDYGCCDINNVILGPLVGIHLSNNNLEKAVSTFTSMAKKYNCTPRQIEVIKEVLNSKDEQLLQRVLESTAKVHGPASAQESMIAGLAENGMVQSLKNLLLTTKVPIKGYLEKRCTRWVKQGKIEALKAVANACIRLSPEVFDVNYVSKCIMDIYSVNNDCESAIKFYQFLEENDIVSETIKHQLLKILQKNNYKIPKNLSIASFRNMG